MGSRTSERKPDGGPEPAEERIVVEPWTKSVEQILSELDVDPERGLGNDEVRRRRDRYGRNLLRKSEKKSVLVILREQFVSLIMFMLAFAAGLSFAFGNWVDGIAIVVAMLINAGIGFVTELKAIRSMESLQMMSSADAKVRREGEVRTVGAEELVPGDLVVIDAGDVITADLRVVEGNNLRLDESTLTGESVPVAKQTETLDRKDVVLAERKNILYKGTAVTRGSGQGVVIATGMQTELGNISSLVQEAEEDTDPLQKRLTGLSRRLIWVILVVAAAAGAGGFIAGKDMFLMIETAVVLAVAAIPEGLPIVATVALARGMHRMAKRNALVRRLSAVQTLGSTNIIFTDKTGTLTENRMTVTRISLAGENVTVGGEGLSTEGGFSRDGEELDPREDRILAETIRVGVLCNNAQLPNHEDGGNRQQREEVLGDPMEVALLVAGAKAGIRREELLERMPEVREVAFDPEVKMMATLHRSDEGIRTAVKGAPAAVLEVCSRILTPEGERELTEDEKREWEETNDSMAAEGLRLLAMASGTVEREDAEPYRDLTFLGIVGLMDPPRKEVRSAIERCQKAGIRVIMVTGDQAPTARNVARAVGLIDREDADVIHGSELKPPDELSEAERERERGAVIFARVSPQQKLNLIDLHKRNGAIVGMTGDGVNDAPALKKADIGIAMGKRGEQVAKDAAEIILQDDAFETILVAIEHGRAIFTNIRKFVIYLLSGNMGEILIVGLAAVVGAPLPLLPLQILYLNAINDVFPALALGLGKEGPDIMERPPRDPQEPILTRKHWIAVWGYGALIAASVLGVFSLALTVFGMDTGQAVTVSFLSLSLGRLWHVFNMRDRGSGILDNQIVKNGFVWGALALCVGLIMMAVYIRPLADILDIAPPGPNGWLLVAGGSILPLILGQIWNSFGHRQDGE